jgi:hypothetical protein
MSNINFEQDKREDLDSVNEAGSLAEQVVKLQRLEEELLEKEDELKELKRKVDLISSEVHTNYDARNEYIYTKIIRRYFG